MAEYTCQLPTNGRSKMSGRRQRVALGKTNRSQANYGSSPNPSSAAETGRSQRRKVAVAKFNQKTPKTKERMNEIKSMCGYRDQRSRTQHLLNQRTNMHSASTLALSPNSLLMLHSPSFICFSEFGEPVVSKERRKWQFHEKHD